jgi:predicted secreted hydrolase
MGKIIYMPGTGVPHHSFEEEFLAHKKCSEWWYCTGYFHTEEGKLFSFQYTLAKVKLLGLTFHMQLNALTDIEKQLHYYSQKPYFFKKGIETGPNLTFAQDKGSIKYSKNQWSSFGKMELELLGDEYKLNLDMSANKSPVWQCEDGLLKMGYTDNPKQITYYFSFTNIDISGTLVLHGKTHQVKGKAWFDRQGGTYTLTDVKCNWEWFSLRFFDNEEAMLFSFPQTGYQDGTYIDQSGKYERLNDYKLTHHTIIESAGYKWSNGWTLKLKGKKAGTYEIIPMAEGQLNLFFFELLARIIDEAGKEVGYCVVELLPGARNPRTSPFGAFKRK